MINFSISIILAYGINEILKSDKDSKISIVTKEGLINVNKKIIFVIFLLIFHFIDIQTSFSRYAYSNYTNNFFPETKAIKYLKSNLKPLESIITTCDVFGVPGFLRAYNIRDLLMHEMNTNSEMRFLGSLSLVKNIYESKSAKCLDSLASINENFFDNFNTANIKYLITDIESSRSILNIKNIEIEHDEIDKDKKKVLYVSEPKKITFENFNEKNI